jgi:hypothetical protein
VISRIAIALTIGLVLSGLIIYVGKGTGLSNESMLRLGCTMIEMTMENAAGEEATADAAKQKTITFLTTGVHSAPWTRIDADTIELGQNIFKITCQGNQVTVQARDKIEDSVYTHVFKFPKSEKPSLEPKYHQVPLAGDGEKRPPEFPKKAIKSYHPNLEPPFS